MSKGSNRRQTTVDLKEIDLRWDLIKGKITEKQFEEKLQKRRQRNDNR